MQRLTEIEIVWISAFNDALSKKVKSLKDGEDICQKQTLNVLRQIKKYIERYPNPQDAAKVMSFTARINYARDEARQRGEGSRKGRFVGQFPTHKTDSGETVEVDLEDLQAVNPETQAVERDLCRQAIKEIKPIAATGFALTAICGYDQGSAAAIAGVTRPYISRQMKQAEREMCDGQHDAA
jgi:DNA-directed RNA polymerase specialized sigma24 family protein